MKEPGYVYILTNPSFKENWVKIGKTSKPVEQRVKDLDGTSVPLPFEVFATMKTVKYSEAERLIHRYIERFTNLRIRNNREFFNVTPEEALDIFRDVAMMLDDAEIEEVHKKSFMGDVSQREKGNHTTPPREDKKIWMIPANSKYFDLAGCIKKYGFVYWAQYFNFQKRDTGYIYCASPDSAIRYKFVVDEQDLKYSSEMDAEIEFYVDPKDFEPVKEHNRFAKLRVISESKSDRLGIAYLMEHGMKSAPRGALNLSHKDNDDLLKYIEDIF